MFTDIEIVKYILYKSGFKYQLQEKFTIKTDITPPDDIFFSYIVLYKSGDLVIYPGFAWDGPSGPFTVDSLSFMRGSLVHDAFYNLFRNGVLDSKRWRKRADEILRELCLEDGMLRVRAWYVYHAVRKFAPRYFKPKPRPVIRAPR